MSESYEIALSLIAANDNAGLTDLLREDPTLLQDPRITYDNLKGIAFSALCLAYSRLHIISGLNPAINSVLCSTMLAAAVCERDQDSFDAQIQALLVFRLINVISLCAEDEFRDMYVNSPYRRAIKLYLESLPHDLVAPRKFAGIDVGRDNIKTGDAFIIRHAETNMMIAGISTALDSEM